MRVSFACITNVGLVRKNNEDNFVVVNGEDGSPHLSPPDSCSGAGDTAGRGMLFAVADGMGGARAGEVASRIAVEAIGRVGQQMTDGDDNRAVRQRILAAIEEANLEIYNASVQNPMQRGMGTTLTVACVRRGRIQFFQVGDSMGYIARRGKLHTMTKSHSLRDTMKSDGVISRGHAEQFERGKNIILRAVGVEENVKIDYSEREFDGGDLVFLCTDGLHGAFRDRELRERFANRPEDTTEFCAGLVQESMDRGGKDNITAIVVAAKNGEAAPRQRWWARLFRSR
ncbi:MAG: protein phosphatase 2C domain-containing protein [Planctomycetota bacterium]